MTNTKTYIGRHEQMSTNNENFDLQTYLTKGAEQLVADALKATLKNPKESAYIMKFALAVRAASKKECLPKTTESISQVF